MSQFFSYSNPVCTQDGLLGVFSYDPSIISLREILLFELKQIAYYASEIQLLGGNIRTVREKIVDFIDITVVNLDFKKETFNLLIKDLRKNKINIEKRYKRLCKIKGCIPKMLKNKDIGGKDIDIIKAINEGEKETVLHNNGFSFREKSLYEIMMNLIAKACFYLSEIKLYEQKRFVDGEIAVLKLLTLTNFVNDSEDLIIENIHEFNRVSDKILRSYRSFLINTYGPYKEVEVPLLMKKGKAILVSGHFFKDLEIVLEATKNTDISVYTHGEMIIAHCLDKFREYPNLVGHYQRSGNDLLLDYSSFPGAILISRNSKPHIDLIRGRIFTFSENPAFGMVSVSENDLSPVIKAAQSAKGFKQDKCLNKITVGYDASKVIPKLDSIISKIKKGKIRHLILIDMLNYLAPTDVYISELLKILPDDFFAISLSYDKNKDNVWHISAYSEMFAFYEILQEIKSKFDDVSKIPLTVFLTKCDRLVIFHILHLLDCGIKNIFLGECCPSMVSPALVKGLVDIYGINQISRNPKADLEKIIMKQSKS